MNDNELRIIEAMVKDKIKLQLEIAQDNFKITGWNESHSCRMAKIDGMIEVLEMFTDKEYYYDENGLHERKDK